MGINNPARPFLAQSSVENWKKTGQYDQISISRYFTIQRVKKTFAQCSFIQQHAGYFVLSGFFNRPADPVHY